MRTTKMGLACLVITLSCWACSTAPEELVELEDASEKSLENYYRNIRTAVERLLEWGQEGHQDVIDWKMRMSIDQLSEEYRVVAEETDDGPVVEARELVHPSDVIELIEVYRAKSRELKESVEQFKAELQKVDQDYLAAVEMRAEIREWLARTGVQPEQIDATTDAIVEAIRGYGKAGGEQ